MRKLITILTIFSTFFFFVEAPYALAVTSIAFDNSWGGEYGGTATAQLGGVTTSGTNRHLICGAITESGTQSISGATFGGVAMHYIGAATTTNAAGTDFGYFYDQVAPSTSSTTFQVTYTGAPGAGKVWLYCNDYTGASQTNVSNFATGINNAAGNSAVTATITIGAATSWGVGLFFNNTNTESIDSAGWSTRQSVNIARISGDSNATIAAGSYNISGHCVGTCTGAGGAVVGIELPVVSTNTFNFWQFFGW